jgi:hypothetical protein
LKIKSGKLKVEERKVVRRRSTEVSEYCKGVRMEEEA